MRRPRIVGLTGGIASGKSSVTQLFSKLGAAIIDADEAARAVVQPGSEGLRHVAEAFGDEVLLPDGSLDRKALAERIFSDADARRRLDSIMHPLIYKRMQQELGKVVSTEVPVVILDIPLLFETGLFLDTIDESLVVYVRPDVQVKRLILRDAIDEQEAARRIAAQMPIDEKAKRAERVVDNNGPWSQTEQQVEAIWKEWTETNENRTHRT